MNKKNGFTLLELLIAATLLAVLVVFATNAYRTSTRNTRLQDLKNQTRALATSIQQYIEEHPNAQFDGSIDISHDLEDLVAGFPDLPNFVDISRQWGWGNVWAIAPCNLTGNKLDGGYCHKLARMENIRPLACLSMIDGKSDPVFDGTYGYGCYAFCVTESGENEFHDDSCIGG